ncbi:MAG: hypothetical protein BWX96_03199 [Bacteroidetes bacterium ADurb.Bin145]|nr:MAG: hypothetical protein BWX96_03199 [Bacteroidetes bacterium ADurb.Bin145]
MRNGTPNPANSPRKYILTGIGETLKLNLGSAGSITSLSALLDAFCISCSALVSSRNVYNSSFNLNFLSIPNSCLSVTGKADACALALFICCWFSDLARLFALRSPFRVSFSASLLARTLISRFLCRGFISPAPLTDNCP